MINICNQCNKEFTAVGAYVKYCSKVCKKAGRSHGTSICGYKECASIFTKKASNHVYCSVRCRDNGKIFFISDLDPSNLVYGEGVCVREGCNQEFIKTPLQKSIVVRIVARRLIKEKLL